MRATTLVRLMFLLPIASYAGDKIQPLNVKTGLWETTMTTRMSGEIPLPAELMSKLTPEQRAAMAARMKANSGEKTSTSTSKSCLTKEQLEKGLAFEQKDKECTQTVVTSNGNKMEMRLECDIETVKMSGIIHVEALSPESMTGSGQTTATGGGHTMNGNIRFSAKWLGPACGSVK